MNVRDFTDNEKEKKSINRVIDQQKRRGNDLKTLLVGLEKNIEGN